MTTALLRERLLAPIADIIEEYDETSLRFRSSHVRITLHTENEGDEKKCCVVHLPLIKPGVYKLIYGPSTYLFAYTLTPLIIYRADVDLASLPPLTLELACGRVKFTTQQLETMSVKELEVLRQGSVYDRQLKGKVRHLSALAFANFDGSSMKKVEISSRGENGLLDIWFSDTVIVFLLSRHDILEMIASSRVKEYFRNKAVKGMKEFVIRSMPEAINIKSSPSGGSVEFKIDEKAALKYRLPSSGKILLAPEGVGKVKGYYTSKNLRELEGSTLFQELRSWFKVMRAISLHPHRNEELTRLYEQIVKENENTFQAGQDIKIDNKGRYTIISTQRPFAM